MAEISVDPYLYVRTAKNPVYNPNGKKISFLSDFTGTVQVWELDRRDGWPAQASFTKEDITFIKYIDGTSDLIIGMDAAGDERVQLCLLKENGELIALTNSPEHVHLYGGSSPNGKWIAWSSNRRNQAFFDIYIQNIETLEIRLVFTQDGTFSVVKWFPDGNSLLIKQTKSLLDHVLGALSLLTGDVNWITEHIGEASFKDVHFNNDGDHIYLLTNKDREFFGLAFIHLATKHFTWLERGEWDYEGLAMNKRKTN